MQHISIRQFFLIFLLLTALFLLLFHAPYVIQGAHAGLELWYEAVLPSILPFMIITSLLLKQLQGRFLCFTGLLCGLPVGANLINLQFQQNVWSRRQANVLLCICNITSPMFILGYILHHSLQNQAAVLPFLLSVYLPICIYTILHLRLLCSADTTTNSNVSEKPNTVESSYSTDEILKNALQIILIIGIIIMLFCIVVEFLLQVLPADAYLLRILLSCLEITNGIRLLTALPISLQQKTALIAGLTSFGGICSIMQTRHVITSKELSVMHYSIIKLCMGIFSYLLIHFFYACNLFPE